MLKHTKDNKGFTLVEVIVVLVILAILAAIMTPSLTGWIDKAKEEALITPCRACVTAAQSLASEAYGKLAASSDIVISEADIIELAGLKDKGAVSGVVIDKATTVIDELTYTEKSTRKSVTYLRLPEPHFVFGEGASEGSALASSTMAKMAAVLAEMESGHYPNKVGSPPDTLDGYSVSNKNSWTYALYSSLSDEQRAFLDKRTWTVIKVGLDLDNNGNMSSSDKGYRIYFTEKNYEKDSRSGMRVYKYGIDGYDPVTHEPVKGKIQYSDEGEVKNGRITSILVPWSEWYDPSELDIK